MVAENLKNDNVALDDTSGEFKIVRGAIPPLPERFQDAKFSAINTIVSINSDLQTLLVILSLQQSH